MQQYTSSEVYQLVRSWLVKQGCDVHHAPHAARFYQFTNEEGKVVASVTINTKKQICQVCVHKDNACAQLIPKLFSAARYLATEGLNVLVVCDNGTWCAMCKNPTVYGQCMCRLYRAAFESGDDMTVATDILSREFIACSPCVHRMPAQL